MKLTLTCDLVKSADYDTLNVLAGTELMFDNFLALRIGYEGNNFFANGDGDGFCTGLGFYLKNFIVDYGFKVSSSLVNSYTHSVGISMKF